MRKQMLFAIVFLVMILTGVPQEYRAETEEDAITRQEAIWEIMNEYADPTYHLEVDAAKEKYSLTDEEYAELKSVAIEVTKECTTQYERIQTITEYISDTIYYDFAWYNYVYAGMKEEYGNYKPDLFTNPYDVFINKRTICAGYAQLTETMLESLGIPCMVLSGFDHAYNAAYDFASERWIFIDTTWCSSNRYVYVDGKFEWIYNGYSLDRFDKTPEYIAGLSNHETYGIDGLVDKTKQLYYSLNCFGKPEEWHLSVSAVIDSNTISGEVTVESIADIPVTSVEESVFSGCTLLTKIILPDTINIIGHDAFANCSSLKEIDLSDTKIQRIGSNAFKGCSSLTKITFPDSLNEFGDHFESEEYARYMFWGCSSLEEVDLSNTMIQRIPRGMFYDCNALETIVLPESLTTIEEQAFILCESLKEIVWPISSNDITIGNSAFFCCFSLTNVVLPKNVTSIGEGAFSMCNQLEEIVLPESVETIGDRVFYGAPEGVKIVICNPQCELPDYQDELPQFATIVGHKGSTAQEYANVNGKDFCDIESIGAWKKYDAGWRYECKYIEGKYITDCWKQIDGTWYYFDKNGIMQTGWLRYGGAWYFLGEDGKMRVGWTKDAGTWYYMNSDGRMHIGWKNIAGKWYYFNADGDMHTSWKKLDGKWYYFNVDGDMHTSWKKLDKKWYYFNANGDMHTGWKEVGGKWYYFNADGDMHTGWKNVNGTWYYLNADGSMRTGWLKDGGKWYYLKPSGVMATGWTFVNGSWYYMYEDGTMAHSTWIGNDYVNENGVYVA